jgi:hypothetical protein
MVVVRNSSFSRFEKRFHWVKPIGLRQDDTHLDRSSYLEKANPIRFSLLKFRFPAAMQNAGLLPNYLKACSSAIFSNVPAISGKSHAPVWGICSIVRRLIDFTLCHPILPSTPEIWATEIQWSQIEIGNRFAKSQDVMLVSWISWVMPLEPKGRTLYSQISKEFVPAGPKNGFVDEWSYWSRHFDNISFGWGVVKISEERKCLGDVETIRSSSLTSGCVIINRDFAASQPCKEEVCNAESAGLAIPADDDFDWNNDKSSHSSPDSSCCNFLGQFLDYNMYSNGMLTCPRYSPNKSPGKREQGRVITLWDSVMGVSRRSSRSWCIQNVSLGSPIHIE